MGQFYQRLADYELGSGATAAGQGNGVHLLAGGMPRAGVLAKPIKVRSTWVPYVRGPKGDSR